MRHITAYVVAEHRYAGSRHMKRMYVVKVNQFFATALQNKKVVQELRTKVLAKLVGNNEVIRETDDFNTVLAEFVASIFRKEYREIETKEWRYILYIVQEDGRSTVMR